MFGICPVEKWSMEMKHVHLGYDHCLLWQKDLYNEVSTPSQNEININHNTKLGQSRDAQVHPFAKCGTNNKFRWNGNKSNYGHFWGNGVRIWKARSYEIRIKKKKQCCVGFSASCFWSWNRWGMSFNLARTFCYVSWNGHVGHPSQCPEVPWNSLESELTKLWDFVTTELK